MVTKVPVYCEDMVTPKVREVIQEILDDRFGEGTTQFRVANRHDQSVLVLGKVTVPGAIGTDVRVEYTYSVAQLMTKANAATVLEMGVRRVLGRWDAPRFRTYKRLEWEHEDEVAFAEFKFDEPVAIDIETSGNLGETHTPEEVEVLSVAVYQPGVGAVVFLSSANYYGDRTVPFSPKEAARMGEFLNKFECAIYHNGKFDIRVLNRVCGVRLHNWFDTMLAHHVLNQAAGLHALKALCKLYFGAEDWESGLNKYLTKGGHYENVPWGTLSKYNAYDVYWTYRLYEMLDPLIDADENATKAFELEMSAAEFLLKVEGRGIPFDAEYADQLSLKLAGVALAHKRVLESIADDDKFNPNSHVQVKKVLAEKFSIVVPSTDAKHMEDLLADESLPTLARTFCEELMGFRKASKMRSVYSNGWKRVARNGKVHPTFLVHGTSTGRLSSKDPNAQNVPRDKTIRKIVAIPTELLPEEEG